MRQIGDERARRGGGYLCDTAQPHARAHAPATVGFKTAVVVAVVEVVVVVVMEMVVVVVVVVVMVAVTSNCFLNGVERGVITWGVLALHAHGASKLAPHATGGRDPLAVLPRLAAQQEARGVGTGSSKLAPVSRVALSRKKKPITGCATEPKHTTTRTRFIMKSSSTQARGPSDGT